MNRTLFGTFAVLVELAGLLFIIVNTSYTSYTTPLFDFLKIIGGEFWVTSFRFRAEYL